MSQFIRSDFNIISSSSRPRTKEGGTGDHKDINGFQSLENNSSDNMNDDGSTGEETINIAELDSRLQTLSPDHGNNISEFQTIAARSFPVGPNNTTSKLGSDDTTRSLTLRTSGQDYNTTSESLMFHSTNDVFYANDTSSVRESPSYELETEPLNDEDGDGTTKNASIQPLVSSPHPNYLSTSSSPFADTEDITTQCFSPQVSSGWKWKIIKDGLDFINKLRKKTPEHDLERQPLLPPSTGDRPGGNPPSGTMPPPEDNIDRPPTTRGPWSDFLAANPWIYYVLGAFLIILGILYFFLTGDITALMNILKALFCSVFGSTVASVLFGDVFCPAFEVTSTAG